MPLAVDVPSPAAPLAGEPWRDVPDRRPDDVGRYAGREACARLVAALRPAFLGRDHWTFSYRSAAGVPSFVITAGGGPGRDAANCFLSLSPAAAPEVFARLVTTLDGYGVGFRAELRGGPATPERIEDAVVTVARPHASTLARVSVRIRDRSPLLFGNSAPIFARVLAPGIGPADEPADGRADGRARHLDPGRSEFRG